jgi:hypothetical protein
MSILLNISVSAYEFEPVEAKDAPAHVSLVLSDTKGKQRFRVLMSEELACSLAKDMSELVEHRWPG